MGNRVHSYCHNNWENRNIDPWYVSKGLFHFLSIDTFERSVLHKFRENKEGTLQKHDDIFALKTNGEKNEKFIFLKKYTIINRFTYLRSNCIVVYILDQIYPGHKNFDNEFPSNLEDINIVLYEVHNVLHFYKDTVLNSQFPSFHLKKKTIIL